MKLVSIFGILFSLHFIVIPLHAQDEALVDELPHTKVNLIADYHTVTAGQKVDVLINMVIDEHWHIYWINSGDSGQAISVDINGKSPVTMGALQFPTPHAIPTPPLMSYGYEHETSLIQTIVLNEDVKGGALSVPLKVRWLECKERCIPREHDGIISLTIDEQAVKNEEAHVLSKFDIAKKAFPKTNYPYKAVTATIEDDYIILHLGGMDKNVVKEAYFFIQEKSIVFYAELQELKAEDGMLKLYLPRNTLANLNPTSFHGILQLNNQEAFSLSVEVSGKETPKNYSFLWILFSSFLAGLILNLMPCVLPVLSLKIFSLIKMSGESPLKRFSHSLVFTLGILICFWALSALIIIFQKVGIDIGWGFQLQSPIVVFFLALGFLLFGLNMLGVFEIGTALTRVSSPSSQGYMSSFGSGIITVLVATPCTAPFMGTAISVAFTQGIAENIIIFSSLGIGLALPYLLVSNFKSLMKLIPKPGAWMLTLKQIMGFLLMATVMFLLYLLVSLTNHDAFLVLLLLLTTAAVAGWIIGKWAIPMKELKTRVIARSISSLILALVIGLGIFVIQMKPGSAWTVYSSDKVDAHLEKGEAVFVNFTADWCLSCKANELVAFQSESVKKKFQEANVNLYKADWTKYDPSITKELRKFNRQSVPLYLYYEAGGNGKPTVLPEIITADTVLALFQ